MYSKITLQDEGRESDLKLYYFGRQECAPGHYWGPGLKDHYKIHHIHRGSGILETKHKRYELHQGMGFLISPFDVAYYRADDKNPWVYSWIAFNGRKAAEYLDRAGLSADHPVFEYLNCDAIDRCFETFSDISNRRNSDLLMLSNLYLYLAVLVDKANPEFNRQPLIKPSQYYINSTINFIETNYSRTISIQEMADHVGLNRNYLTRIFKEITGTTPQNFLIDYRLLKAGELLKGTHLSISEISNSVGYKDQLLFSRMFKKYKGISPSEFRRNHTLPV